MEKSRIASFVFVLAVCLSAALGSATVAQAESLKQSGFPDRASATAASLRLQATLVAKHFGKSGWSYTQGVDSYKKKYWWGSVKFYEAWAKAEWKPPFQGGTNPGRTVMTTWVYSPNQFTGGGYFKKQGMNWIEVSNGRQIAAFRETFAGSDRVELFDASRNLYLRLDQSRAYWKVGNGQWNFIYNRAR